MTADSAMTPLPADDPMLVAFNAWINSDDGKNAVKWSVYQDHSRGSLWAAFVAAWNRRAPVEISEEMVERALAAHQDWYRTHGGSPDHPMRAALAAALNGGKA